MKGYLNFVSVPAASTINKGLEPCHHATMMHLFGAPGALTPDCSPVTNARLAAQIVTHKFNNFTVTGWGPAVEDLQAILLDIYQYDKDLHALIGTAGMLCCRKVRVPGSHNFSNHSWGGAIDLKIGSILSPQGARMIPRALLAVYPFFNDRGWYWGQGFPTSDPMHFEPSDARIRSLFAAKNGNATWGTP